MTRDPDGHADHALDALLHSAAPSPRDAAEQEAAFADVWSRVQGSMTEDRTPVDDLQGRRLDLIADRETAARRRRRASRLASVALAVAVAGGGTAAAADYIATRTGAELTGWEVGAGGSGEVLDRAGTDLRQVVAEATADIPFAPGYQAQHDQALDHYGAPDPGSAITTSTLRSGVAGYAVCTWADAWVAADDAGDATARAEATGTLSASLSWEPFTTFARDHGEPVPAEATPGDESYRWWLRPLAEGAQAGDRQAVLDAVADSHTCGYEYIPVIDADPAYEFHGLPR